MTSEKSYDADEGQVEFTLNGWTEKMGRAVTLRYISQKEITNKGPAGHHKDWHLYERELFHSIVSSSI